VRLATQFAPESEVRTRLQELADDEARIIGAGDPLPRMHS
jgi:tRNA isopentenyl-2-thiomethyl-A-37 hydroxylase MiaE